MVEDIDNNSIRKFALTTLVGVTLLVVGIIGLSMVSYNKGEVLQGRLMSPTAVRNAAPDLQVNLEASTGEETMVVGENSLYSFYLQKDGENILLKNFTIAFQSRVITDPLRIFIDGRDVTGLATPRSEFGSGLKEGAFIFNVEFPRVITITDREKISIVTRVDNFDNLSYVKSSLLDFTWRDPEGSDHFQKVNIKPYTLRSL